MKANKYTLTARAFPALITLVPITICISFFLNSTIEAAIGNKILLKLAGNLSLSVVIFYFLTQVIRFIGKEVFERIYFKNELRMPTTDFLMPNDNNLSAPYKEKIYSKIKKDFRFSIDLSQNENDLRKQIVEAVGMIRSKIKDGRLLLQHNIEYGFSRNLIGGSPLAFIFSIVNLYLYRQQMSLFYLNIIFACFFGLLLMLSKFIINRFGVLYAKRLYQEYVSG